MLGVVDLAVEVNKIDGHGEVLPGEKESELLEP
jgi:hypothetical protein